MHEAQMRKLYWFVQQDAAFFRGAHLLSFGGTQSNAMLAIAQLAHIKRTPFTYFSRGLAVQDAQPAGNLEAALALGMRHVTLSPEDYQSLFETRDFTAVLPTEELSSTPMFIPQGGAFPKARVGVAVLADEINSYVTSEFPDTSFAVVLPCGTGTTAFYLAQHVLPSIEVLAVPCVGDGTYLKQQFQQLARDDPSISPATPVKMPTVLEPPRKSRFGRLWPPLLDMYRSVLAETGIKIDLNYGAFAWHALFSDDASLARRILGGKRELLYVHTGGVSGNATMLARYERKMNK